MRRLAILATLLAWLGLAATAKASPAGLFHVAASSNWAGYAVSGSTFTDAKGSWVQPAVTCPNASSSFAAFWVGLGGFSGGGGLEQIGTESDCRRGSPAYSAWYELLPAGSVNVALTVSAGDTISAEVSASGPVVTLTIADLTTGAAFTTQATPSALDTSSAEWIAEAPAQCFGALPGRCLTLPLADFGTLQFSGSSTTANGHVGTISDESWSATSIQLGGHAGSAIPATLSTDGSSFTVSWLPTGPARRRFGWSSWSD